MLIPLESMELALPLFGARDQNIAVLEQELQVSFALRGSRIEITGEEENCLLAKRAAEKLQLLIRRGETPDPARVRYLVSLIKENLEDRMDEILQDVVAVTHRGRPIKARTLGQRDYVEKVKHNTLTLAVGPAGTGKTYLAMAMAVVALRNKEVERIVLTRPAVEAGEKLGFLPGDMTQKVDPYLRPLFDALYELMGVESYQRLQERGTLEIAPLAFMRGRTLNDSFIILDEAQNTTAEQMKMFLTRLGQGSRCVVTGDMTQIDLPKGRISGLAEALQVLKGVPDVGIAMLLEKDVVRHELVQRIVQAYDRYENAKSSIRTAEEK